MIRRKIVILLALGWFIPTSLGAISGQNGTVTVSPALIRVELTNDDPVTVSFDATNTGNIPLPVSLKVFDVGNDSPASIPWSYGATIAPQYGLARWMSVNPPALVLQPQATQSITAIISPDSTMSAGGHYGSVVISLNDTNLSASQIGVQGRISVLVFATKVGGKEQLSLTRVTHRRTLWSWPAATLLTFANTGNTDLLPHGRLTVTKNGTTIASAVLNQDSQPVFPETSRDYLIKIPKPDRILPARYLVSVDYQAGAGIKGSQQNHIVIIPEWFLIVGSALLLLFFTSVMHRRRPH